jgi:hypothetical protein
MRGLTWRIVILVYTALPLPSAWAQATGADAVKAVQEATDDFLRAYGAWAAPQTPIAAEVANPSALARNSLSELMAEFDDRATYAGTLQPFWLRGKAAINDLWARYFARYPDRRMIFRQQDVQLFGNAAVETGYAEMYMGASPTNTVVTFMRYSITRVQRDGRWLIVNMIVDRLPADQPAPGTMPAWANAPSPAQ